MDQRLQFAALARTYDAELWLVHRKPDGTETVQQQTLHFGGLGVTAGSFPFPPIQVPTSKGPITIDITGKLQSSVGVDGAGNRFAVVDDSEHEPRPAPSTSRCRSIAARDAARSAAARHHRRQQHGHRRAGSPTDVLSFEFPALQKSTEDLLKGHQFSLRVRVTPSGK